MFSDSPAFCVKHLSVRLTAVIETVGHWSLLAVGGNFIRSEGGPMLPYTVVALKELLGTVHNQFWLCLDLSDYH